MNEAEQRVYKTQTDALKLLKDIKVAVLSLWYLSLFWTVLLFTLFAITLVSNAGTYTGTVPVDVKPTVHLTDADGFGFSGQSPPPFVEGGVTLTFNLDAETQLVTITDYQWHFPGQTVTSQFELPPPALGEPPMIGTYEITIDPYNVDVPLSTEPWQLVHAEGTRYYVEGAGPATETFAGPQLTGSYNLNDQYNGTFEVEMPVLKEWPEFVWPWNNWDLANFPDSISIAGFGWAAGTQSDNNLVLNEEYQMGISGLSGRSIALHEFHLVEDHEPIPGDINLDGMVDNVDVGIVFGNFGMGWQRDPPVKTVPEPTGWLLALLGLLRLVKWPLQQGAAVWRD